MGLNQPSDLAVPSEPGPDALMLVEGDGHSVTCTAKGDSEVNLFLLDSLRKRVGIVRIVAAGVGISPVVSHIIAFLGQQLSDSVFVLIAGMVTGDSDFHDVSKIVSFCSL